MDTLVLIDVSENGREGPGVMLHKIEIIAPTRGNAGDYPVRIYMANGETLLSPLTYEQFIARIMESVLKAAGVDE